MAILGVEYSPLLTYYKLMLLVIKSYWTTEIEYHPWTLECMVQITGNVAHARSWLVYHSRVAIAEHAWHSCGANTHVTRILKWTCVTVTDYSGTYRSLHKQGLKCKPVFEYRIIADNHRELLYWNVAGGRHCMVSNLMIVDSRIYYRTLSIASLNKPACYITCYHFNIYYCVDSWEPGHLQTWWWQISLQIITVI